MASIGKTRLRDRADIPCTSSRVAVLPYVRGFVVLWSIMILELAWLERVEDRVHTLTSSTGATEYLRYCS